MDKIYDGAIEVKGGDYRSFASDVNGMKTSAIIDINNKIWFESNEFFRNLKARNILGTKVLNQYLEDQARLGHVGYKGRTSIMQVAPLYYLDHEAAVGFVQKMIEYFADAMIQYQVYKADLAEMNGG